MTRSTYEWRNPRGAVTRSLERVTDLPANVLQRGALTTDSAKRRIYEDGVVGEAQIVERPTARTSGQGQAEGRFRVLVIMEGREPYEVRTRQSYSGWEWDLLAEGEIVECRLAHGKVLLCAPEP